MHIDYKPVYILWAHLLYLINNVMWFYGSTWLGHGVPDIWSNVIVGVSTRVFLDKINIYIVRLSKALSKQLKTLIE